MFISRTVKFDGCCTASKTNSISLIVQKPPNLTVFTYTSILCLKNKRFVAIKKDGLTTHKSFVIFLFEIQLSVKMRACLIIGCATTDLVKERSLFE